jgi:hypothetical protein
MARSVVSNWALIMEEKKKKRVACVSSFSSIHDGLGDVAGIMAAAAAAASVY